MGSFVEKKWFQYKEDLNRLRLFRLWKDMREREEKMLRLIKRKDRKQINKKSTEKSHQSRFSTAGQNVCYML